MLVSIGAYDLCDGTLTGGVAISDLRLNIERGFDVVIPVDEVSPVLLDRFTSKSDLSFTIKRVHADLDASEDFIIELEETLPRSGSVKLVSSDGTIRYIPNGFVVAHNLIQQIGATTFHEYRIVGGPTNVTDVSPPPTPPPAPGGTGPWRLVTVTGPPDGVKLQVLNSSDVWEDVWEYTAST